MNFDGARLEAASVYQLNLTKASLIAANMRGARMVKADLGDAAFSDADPRLDAANLRATVPSSPART